MLSRIAIEDAVDRLALSPWLVAGIGLAYPQVFGVGYESIEQALRGETALELLGVLLVLKILATCITIGSGG